MGHFKVSFINLAAPLDGHDPAPPHPKIEKCDTLEKARFLVEREFKAHGYEFIKISIADNTIIEEYRSGIRYVAGKKSPLA